MKPRIVCSFSGGETSAFMTQWVNSEWGDTHDILNIFANTGEENEETLRFTNQCDEYFGLDLVWVEADVQYGKRKGCKANVVTYETASRNGEPFDAMVKKYGIPNKTYPHCTRELKENPIRDYIRSIGWKKGTYKLAIGIRIDEFDRMSSKTESMNIIYPLISKVPMTKPDINAYWNVMPFRLNLKGYEGNCKVCWKKSMRKILTIAQQHPGRFYKFWEIEKKYEHYSKPGRTNPNPPYRFYRQNLSIHDIFKLLKEGDFELAEDDSVVYPKNDEHLTELLRDLDINLDEAGGCSESCEVFTD